MDAPEETRLTDDMRAAGKRLRGRILELMAREQIDTFISLAGRPDSVSYVTLRHWFTGETRPRGFQLSKVAKILRTTLDDLDAAYEGRAKAEDAYSENQELLATLRRLTEELHHLATVQELLLPEAGRATLAGLRDAAAEARQEDEDPPGVPLPEHLLRTPSEWRQ